MTNPQPAPGWYPDPDGSGGQRWWDGQQWTTNQQSTPQAAGAYAGFHPHSALGGGQPNAAAQAWSYVKSKPDAAPIQRGDSRWVAGVAMIASGVVLLLASFMDWYSMTDGSFSINGIAGFSPNCRYNYECEYLRSTVDSHDHPGVYALLAGVLSILAGLAFLRLSWRIHAALAVATIAGIELLICLAQATNASATMQQINGAEGLVTFDAGLFLAGASALALTATGITAFVLERSAIATSSSAAAD